MVNYVDYHSIGMIAGWTNIIQKEEIRSLLFLPFYNNKNIFYNISKSSKCFKK